MELDQWKASDGFAKSICTICLEGLNPIIEVIQSISVCGHVFHEFCLQQLLEPLPEAKKKRCPICKQKFSHKHVSRLYLQWVDDESKASATAKSPPCGSIGDNARLSRGELVTLEEKLAFVDQGLEQQQKCLRELKEELSIAKDLAGRETALKVEAVTENSIFQQMLNEKMEELEQSKAERSKLQNRILALEKELAANKLVSNLNLDEEDISRLAYANHEGNGKNFLRKPLILHNRRYKDMMAQCDLLAREEQNSQKKLAKAVQKKEKLKEKLKELKTALGEKDNEILRKKEKMKEKLKKLKRALEENDKENLRSSKICKRARVEEAHENGNKPYMENSRTRVKKEYAGGTSESCCTDLLSNHASDAKANAGFPEKQGASRPSSTEVIYLDMEGQAYFQTEMDRSTDSQKGTWEQYPKKPTELVADEQATPHMNIEKIEERSPIFEGLLGSCPQDNAGHSMSQAPKSLITVDDDVILPKVLPMKLLPSVEEAHAIICKDDSRQSMRGKDRPYTNSTAEDRPYMNSTAKDRSYMNFTAKDRPCMNSTAMITKEGRLGEKSSLSLTPQDPKSETGHGKTIEKCTHCRNSKHTRDKYPDCCKARKPKDGNRVGSTNDRWRAGMPCKPKDGNRVGRSTNDRWRAGKPCKPKDGNHVGRSNDDWWRAREPCKPKDCNRVGRSNDDRWRAGKPCKPKDGNHVGRSIDDWWRAGKPCKPKDGNRVGRSIDVWWKDRKPRKPKDGNRVGRCTDALTLT